MILIKISPRQQDMPIVIGDSGYRNKGIGYKAITALLGRAKDIGFDRIYVQEIYAYNIGSQKSFEKAGFKKYRETAKGYSYVCDVR